MSIANIKRKNSKTYKFVFTNSDGSVKDISGWQVYFTLKLSIDDMDSNAAIKILSTAGDDSADDPTSGLMYLSVSSVDTDLEPDTYHYDFTRVIPGSTPNVKSMDSGTVDILKSVLENVA